jgi:hypothetical protein
MSKKRISKKEYGRNCTIENAYKNYFSIINGLLGLTNKEVEIVSKLYYYNYIISKSVDDERLRGVLLFSKEYKNKIVKELDIKSLLFNNYISSLKSKSIILVDEDNTSFKWLNSRFVLDIGADAVQIIFNLNINKDEKKETNEEVKEVSQQTD